MIGLDDVVDNVENLPEAMLPYERSTFLWLNNHHSDFWDTFMMTYSGKVLWIPLCLVMLFTIFYKTKWQNTVLFLLCFALLATLCDQISAGVVKPFFSRFRPTHHPDFMNEVLTVNGYRGGRYGFVSAHACNALGIVTFVSLVFKQKWLTCTLIVWSLITCYSRIYLGVHFITDILGGIFLGMTIGFLIYLLYQFCRLKVLKKNLIDLEKSIYSKTHGYIIIVTIFATIIFNVIYSLK